MADSASIGLICLAVGLIVLAALHDAAARTIPNSIPLVLVGVGAGLRLLDGNLILGVAIAMLLFIMFAALWLRGFIGGGDAKLAAALSLVLPPAGIPYFILFVALAGGVLALIYLSLSYVIGRPRPGPRHGFLSRLIKAEAWRMHRRGPLPYAVAITAGALPILVKTAFG